MGISVKRIVRRSKTEKRIGDNDERTRTMG